MTRIALISDQHFDTASRWEECIRITDWIAADLARRGVDVIALGGDLFERRPVPEESAAAARWLVALGELAPVEGVYGNHDVPLSLAVFNQLDTRHGVHFSDRPEVRQVAGCSLACLPWPTTGNLLAQMPEASKEGGDQAAVEMLRSILRGLGSQMDDTDGPRILLAHAMVTGAKTSAGQPLIGLPLSVALEDLALARADAYLLGHIHCPNDWAINGAPVIYPGSPRRTAFGEVEEKGYVVLEFEGRKLIGWERIATPATPMLLISVETARTDDGRIVFDDDGIEWTYELAGAEVRFRYEVAADLREAAKLAAKERADAMRAAGAISVKVEEEITATVRARAPEITAARTLPDKLDALWRLQGFEPGERRPVLFDKVTNLEKEMSDGR